MIKQNQRNQTLKLVQIPVQTNNQVSMLKFTISRDQKAFNFIHLRALFRHRQLSKLGGGLEIYL